MKGLSQRLERTDISWCRLRLLRWRRWLGAALLAAPGVVLAEETLRGVVVSVLAQEQFLERVVATLPDAPQGLELRMAHVEALPSLLAQGDVDFVMAHGHAEPARALEADGVLLAGRPILANAKVFLSPAAVGLAPVYETLAALAEASAARGLCFLPRKPKDARNFAPLAALPRCEAINAGESLARQAVSANGIAPWGLHPYLRRPLAAAQASVVTSPEGYRALLLWRVAGSDAAAQVAQLGDALCSEAGQAAVAAFRLTGQDRAQPAFFPICDGGP